MNNKEILENISKEEDVVISIRQNLDELLKIIPEIKDMIGFEHRHPHHHLDVWEHTLLALKLSEKNFDVRLILLLHDIGKPHTCTSDEKGVRHFYGHGKASAKMGKEILTRLGFENSYINKICKIIEQHDDKITEEEIVKDINFAKLKFKVQICDALAHNPETNRFRYAYIKKIKKLIKFYENEKELN